MRLLHSTELIFYEFFDDVPTYGILSHTWEYGEEVSFTEMCGLIEAVRRGHSEQQPFARTREKTGYNKILKTCELARHDKLDYVWVDTCCINKDSSAELSEAINSMFRWYESSTVCYIYLVDVEWSTPSPSLEYFDALNAYERRLRSCRYWTRGWTLQELLAPADRRLYDRQWAFIGAVVPGAQEDVIFDSNPLLMAVASITGINMLALQDAHKLSSFSIAKRMSWAAHRTTSRTEDQAYALLGIFDVNMPLLYGEGSRAFTRLQEEIIKTSDDQSIFAWHNEPEANAADRYTGFLAPSPSGFSRANGIGSFSHDSMNLSAPYHMTNRGLRITLKLCRERFGERRVYAALNCSDGEGEEPILICVAEPWSQQDDLFGGPSTDFDKNYDSPVLELDGIHRDLGLQSPRPLSSTVTSAEYIYTTRTILVPQPHYSSHLRFDASEYSFHLRRPSSEMRVSITAFREKASWVAAKLAYQADDSISGGDFKLRNCLQAVCMIDLPNSPQRFFVLARRSEDASILTCYMISCALNTGWTDIAGHVDWNWCQSSLAFCPSTLTTLGEPEFRNCLHAEIRLSERPYRRTATIVLYTGQSMFRGDGVTYLYPSQGLVLPCHLITIPPKYPQPKSISDPQKQLPQSNNIEQHNTTGDWTSEYRPMLEQLHNWRKKWMAYFDDVFLPSEVEGTENLQLKDYWYFKELLNRCFVLPENFVSSRLESTLKIEPWLCRPPKILAEVRTKAMSAVYDPRAEEAWEMHPAARRSRTEDAMANS